MKTLLVEVGCEELPAAEIRSLAERLGEHLLQLLADHDLTTDASHKRVWSTPRRLAAEISGLQEATAPTKDWRRGPTVAQAKAPDGSWSRAAIGFAQSLNTTPDQLTERDVDGGRYMFGQLEKPGVSVHQLLASELQRLVGDLPKGRTMVWQPDGMRFVRPVRWLVVLLDQDVVACEVAGVHSGRSSAGLRGQPVVELASAQAYQAALAAAGVIVDPKSRRHQLVAGWQALLAVGESFDQEAALIDQVVDLVEGVRVLRGHASEVFAELPESILQAVLVDQMRVVPITLAGQLQPGFLLAFQSGDADVVRQGFERVLAARLADALFFTASDLAKPLADHAKSLAGITFLGKLGSLQDRQQRLQAMVPKVAREASLHLDEAQSAAAVRLVLADRATQAVAEWPELAGVIGATYAARQGVAEPVVTAIAESVLPLQAGGPLPASDLGWTLAVCLRADELVGGFVAGLEPTGSSDPFGLRRAAQALLSLLQEKRLAWQELVAEAEAGYSLPPNVRSEIGLKVDRFLRSRLEASWREAGHRPEAVAATLGTVLSHPARLASRLAAVEQMWEDSSFQALITVYRRASRLAEEGPIDPAAGEEAVLKKAVVDAEVAVERQLLQGQDLAALATLASLEGPLARFFDQVMVMDPNPVRRRVRQALLHRVKALSDRLVALSAVAGGREVSA